MTWIEGPPTRPGYYWLAKTGMGGYSNVVLVRIDLRCRNWRAIYDRLIANKGLHGFRAILQDQEKPEVLFVAEAIGLPCEDAFLLSELTDISHHMPVPKPVAT